VTLSGRPGLDPLEQTATGARQIHLIGFMGAGKSTVARLLARRLVWNYLDIDVLIARHAGHSVAEIFATEGEAAFREYEQHALRMAVQKPRTVVALGGGTTLAADNWDVIRRSALSVWLQVSFATCAERVGGSATRPLFRDAASARALFDARVASYSAADRSVDAEGSADDVALAIEGIARGA
jgi:shikimate kinase